MRGSSYPRAAIQRPDGWSDSQAFEMLTNSTPRVKTSARKTLVVLRQRLHQALSREKTDAAHRVVDDGGPAASAWQQSHLYNACTLQFRHEKTDAPVSRRTRNVTSGHGSWFLGPKLETGILKQECLLHTGGFCYQRLALTLALV